MSKRRKLEAGDDGKSYISTGKVQDENLNEDNTVLNISVSTTTQETHIRPEYLHCQYLHNVTEELTCSICSELYVNAVTLTCSHTFCRMCYTEWEKRQTACPLCRTFTISAYPTRVIDNLVKKYIEIAPKNVKNRYEQIAQQRTLQEESTSSEESDTDASFASVPSDDLSDDDSDVMVIPRP